LTPPSTSACVLRQAGYERELFGSDVVGLLHEPPPAPCVTLAASPPMPFERLPRRPLARVVIALLDGIR
jgi:hypothetical protein